MVNSYDVAILSEKVAYLEAALKSAGIELPVVTSEDNGKTLQVVNGAWATGSKIPGVINALDSISETDALSAAQGKALNDLFSEYKHMEVCYESVSFTNGVATVTHNLGKANTPIPLCSNGLIPHTVSGVTNNSFQVFVAWLKSSAVDDTQVSTNYTGSIGLTYLLVY